MARLFTGGGEWNDATAEGVSVEGGTPSFTTSNVRTGTYAYRGVTPSDAWRAAFTGVLGRTYYGRAYVRLDALPSAGNLNALVSFAPAGAVVVDSAGVIKVGNSALLSTVYGTSATTMVAGTYYMVELAVNIGTGSVDTIEARIDGVSFGATTGLALSDTAISRFVFATAVQVNATADDVAVNDDQGAAQNSWPGSEKVFLLLPISNNAVGTGWTLGTGTAMGAGWDAVNNTPPLGVADLTAGSDTKQIRNASSNANVNYDANLTTYATAGIAAADTINVVVPVIATGAPVVTSAKAGTVGIVSNPTIANVALGAGGTAGAFWSGVAAGTYPTGWKWSFGTTTYAPSVTVGTSPVMRVTQVTASTRIADVCAMGMYVGYTPAVTVLPPKTVTVISQAVNRAACW